MQITITIPKLTTIRAHWRWGMLAAFMLAFTLTWSSPAGAPPVEAAGDAEMSLDAKNFDTGDFGLVSCDLPSKPTKCEVTVGQQFDIIVDVNAITSGYDIFFTEINPGGLIFKPGPGCEKEVIWPEPSTCFSIQDAGGNARVIGTSTAGKSTFLGAVAKYNVACPVTPGGHKVTLVPRAGAAGTFLFNSATGVAQEPKEQVPGLEVDSLTINCVQSKSEININPVQKNPGPPPFGCYEVRDNLQNPLFQVCDNNAQAGFPQSVAGLCDLADGTAACEDSDPAKGQIRVSVGSGNYNVVESMTPPNYDPTNSGKQSCTALPAPKCELTFQNTAQTVAWFPEDITGDGQVALGDFLRLLAVFSQTKP